MISLTSRKLFLNWRTSNFANERGTVSFVTPLSVCISVPVDTESLVSAAVSVLTSSAAKVKTINAIVLLKLLPGTSRYRHFLHWTWRGKMLYIVNSWLLFILCTYLSTGMVLPSSARVETSLSMSSAGIVDQLQFSRHTKDQSSSP